MIKKVKKGFTLIELVVVIAVIAILSAVSVVAYVGITNNAKKSAASQKATQMVTTIRAAVLASAGGGYVKMYDDDNNVATPEVEDYKVTLDGKVLSFFDNGSTTALNASDDTDNAAIIVIISDMFKDLEGTEVDATRLAYRASTTESEIGVLPDGKKVDEAGAKDFVWVSF